MKKERKRQRKKETKKERKKERKRQRKKETNLHFFFFNPLTCRGVKGKDLGQSFLHSF